MGTAVARAKAGSSRAKVSVVSDKAATSGELPSWFCKAAKAPPMDLKIVTVSAALDYCRAQYEARKIKCPDLAERFQNAVKVYNEAQGREDGETILGVILVCIAGVQEKDERIEAPKREKGQVWGLPLTTFNNTALPEEFGFTTYQTEKSGDNDLDIAAAALQEAGLLSRYMKKGRPTIAKIGPSQSESKVSRAMGAAFGKRES